jgi:tRNA/rRNA methyltransferase
MRLRLVLVEPRYEGNVGSVARAMMNFGFQDLVLVNPCPIEDFGRAMASHAGAFLARARTVSSLEEATRGADLVVGTTGKSLENVDRHLRLHLRFPFFTPRELKEKLAGKDGEVALLLGREDIGLSNFELMACDMVVIIPTSQSYPVMNLSHAAAVLLYELGHVEAGETKLASEGSLQLLRERTRTMLLQAGYPAHKVEYTLLMLRRVLGRSELTEREARTLLGIIKSLSWRIGQGPSSREEEDEGEPERD